MTRHLEDKTPPGDVLHVLWQTGIGGAQRAVYQLVREQRRRGVSANVLAASTSGLYGDSMQAAGATVYELRCRGAWDATRAAAARRIAENHQIAHVHGIEPILIASIFRSGATLVYTHRGGARSHGLIKRLRIATARPMVGRFAAISGNTKQSAHVAASWLAIPTDNVRVIYNGIDFDLLEPRREVKEALGELPPQARGSPIIGTAAHLQPWKRVHLLLQAVALSRSEIHCIVLGNGPSRADLERLALNLGLSDRVTFLGTKEHIGDYLQLLDAFVLPSGPEEAFGNAAVEAMGLGIPTLVFRDGGGLTEHIVDHETGLVVDNTLELARALDELVRDVEERKRLGEAGRRYVRSTYTVDAMFDGYAELYARALGGSPWPGWDAV